MTERQKEILIGLVEDRQGMIQVELKMYGEDDDLISENDLLKDIKQKLL